jgi:hypothetical protein
LRKRELAALCARSPEVMRAAGGYRDIHYRFPSGNAQAPQTASRSVSSRWR